MSEASDPDTGERRGGLYDSYVDAALSGDAPVPAAFLAEHGVVDDELRARLEIVHRAACRAARPDDDGTLPFERLGGYRVLRRLDEGGMGMVFLGAEDRLGRLVALKVLRPELQGSATQAARFEREAQVVARLRHPNIVTIFGVGEEGGRRFLAMEYVEGEGLDDVVANAREAGRPIPVETCARWAIQVAGALQAAHDAGVVHRDVKPSNVRIDRDGNAVLLDFGIAAEEGTSRLTKTGKFLGTAAYAAPEQLRGTEGQDGRADVYALGLVLYEALTGVQPFEGATEVETVERVLRDDAQPARRLRGDIPHDLETVLSVALERDASRRYASARAFADDLRAVLEIRPIAARRAGVVRRTWKLARRHPVAAASIVLVAAAVATGVIASEVRDRNAAREALARARDGVVAYRAQCEAARDAEVQYRWLDRLVESVYMSEDEDRRYAEASSAVHSSRREREAVFHEVLDELRTAERLHPSLAGVDEVLASLYMERWREADMRRDDDAAAFYRQRVIDSEPDGVFAAELHATAPVIVRCDTPGAQARAYEWRPLSEVLPGGEPRLVPVPLGGSATDVQPGDWAYRLLADHGSLLADDLIVRVDGETPNESNWSELADRLASGARVLVHGFAGQQETELPAGARVRITTQPLVWVGGADVLGVRTEVPPGPAQVVVRAPGYESRRVAVFGTRDVMGEYDVELLPAGTTPEGFVHVVPRVANEHAPYWIQEREISAAEYLEFLNSPETLAEIDAAMAPIRFPRSPRTAAEGGHWPRGEDGRYSLAEDWPADWPAIGVSFEDAQAYVAWWNRRARRDGSPWVAALPTMDQWTLCGEPSGDRTYSFGNQFNPKWLSSCFSQPQARPESVMSYPRDESVYGVFDMSGSAWEWTDDWWDEENGLRRLAGGSWARAQREFFKIWGGIGEDPEKATDETSFRLALRWRDDASDGDTE